MYWWPYFCFMLSCVVKFHLQLCRCAAVCTKLCSCEWRLCLCLRWLLRVYWGYWVHVGESAVNTQMSVTVVLMEADCKLLLKSEKCFFLSACRASVRGNFKSLFLSVLVCMCVCLLWLSWLLRWPIYRCMCNLTVLILSVCIVTQWSLSSLCH